MSLSFCNSVLLQLLPHPRWPLFLYAAAWTTILTLTVAVASFVPELAFVSAMTSSTCRDPSSVRLPLDIPSENLCFPSRFLKRSRLDFLVPPVFAAVIVAGSACVVRAMGLFEVEDEQFSSDTTVNH